MTLRGMTVEQAIAIALEGISGDLNEWVSDDKRQAALRGYLVDWVTDWAAHRGVSFQEADVIAEIDTVIANLAELCAQRGKARITVKLLTTTTTTTTTEDV